MSRAVVARGDDVALSVEITGEDATKPWLLVSNSLGADLGMWDQQMEWLTQTHRVIRYDTRGHGLSSAPDGPYSFDDLVADMVAVLDHAGAERADVLGLSLGGMTAIGLAIHHPQRVGRMVVCDARADNPELFRTGWDDRIALIHKGGMAAIVDGTMARWFTPTCPPAIRERAEDMMRSVAPVGYIGCALALKELDYLKDLGSVGAEVLYVVGEEDLAAPKAAMEEMASATPHADLKVLPELAHVPNMENPAVFEAAIRPFLTP